MSHSGSPQLKSNINITNNSNSNSNNNNTSSSSINSSNPVAHLKNGSINVESLRDAARRELVNLLDGTGSGRKLLVIDQPLIGPLGAVAEYSLLTEHGVSKLFHLDGGALNVPADIRTVVYLCRPKAILMRRIADNIRLDRDGAGRDIDRNFHVFFVPRQTRICRNALEEGGVWADVHTKEFHIDLLPLDNDLLSLEMAGSFRDVALLGDRTPLFYVARALMKLQAMYGLIPSIVGKGESARHVADMLLRMRRELGADVPVGATEIDQLVLIDREVDLVTPMCLQLTYEGLIDEVFGIDNGFVALPAEVTGAEDDKVTKLPLNSADSLYKDIRDRNFATVGPLLNQRAKRISQNYDERHDAKTVGQIKDFISKLGGLQAEHASLRLHTNIAEQILNRTKDDGFFQSLEVEQSFVSGVDTGLFNDYIDTMVSKQEPLVKVLRLMCLQSLTNGGLKPKVFDQYRRDILQAYGYTTIFALNNLEKLGLLRRQDVKNVYASLSKSLRLIVDDVDENNPKDIAYVHSGYAPLSVRLLQHAVKPGGLRILEDTLRHLPGPDFEERQDLPSGVHRKRTAGVDSKPPVTLVFFLGGCTRAEVGAVRFLTKQNEGCRDFVIGTTKLITGNSMLEQVMEEVQNNFDASNSNSTIFDRRK